MTPGTAVAAGACAACAGTPTQRPRRAAGRLRGVAWPTHPGAPGPAASRARSSDTYSSTSQVSVNKWLAGRALPMFTNAHPFAVPWSQIISSKLSSGKSHADWVLNVSRA